MDELYLRTDEKTTLPKHRGNYQMNNQVLESNKNFKQKNCREYYKVLDPIKCILIAVLFVEKLT